MDRRNNARAKHTNWRSPTLKWRFIILFIVAFQLSYAIFTENDHVLWKVSFISGLTDPVSISWSTKNAHDMIMFLKRNRKYLLFSSKNDHILWNFRIISRQWLTFQPKNRLDRNSRLYRRVLLALTSSWTHFRPLHDPIFSQNLKQPPWDELGPMPARVFRHRNSRMDPSFLVKYHYKYSIYRNSRKNGAK